MKTCLFLVTVLALSAATFSPAAAGEEGALEVGGKIYFDAFADLTDRDAGDPTPTHGVAVRRIYLTIQRTWGDVAFRHTTDVDTKFGAGNLNVFSKYAYLEHRGLIPDAKVLIGQHSPKTHGWTEKRWKYRSMAMVMSDVHKWTHSAGFGIGVQGKTMDGKIEYYADVNNGNGYKKRVAKDGLGLAGRVAFQPAKGVWVSGLATANAPGGIHDDDPDDPDPNFVDPVALDGFDVYLEGLVGWEGKKASAFAQYGTFKDAQYTNGSLNPIGDFDERTSSGFSVFGRARLTDDLWAVGRFDRVDPDTDTSDDAADWILVGVSHELSDGFFLQPNVVIESPEASGAETETEVRLTFYGKI